MSDSNWMPSLEAAKHDTVALSERVAQSFLDVAAQHSPECRERVSSAIDFLYAAASEKPAVCHPEVFSCYFTLVDEIAADAGSRSTSDLFEEIEFLPIAVRRSLARADEGQLLIGARVDLGADGPGIQRSLARGMKEVSRLAARNTQLGALRQIPEDVLTRVRTAIDLIRMAWPEAYEEMVFVLDRLLIYEGHSVIGFTDFRCHGSIFFKYEWLIRRPSEREVAEDLIHEVAHVRLNGMLTLKPAFTNDFGEIYPTPLRSDLRSMYGVFHQMYVLLRVAELYRRFDLLHHETALEKCLMRTRQSLEAYETVSAHAALTAFGRDILRSIRTSYLISFEPLHDKVLA